MRLSRPRPVILLALLALALVAAACGGDGDKKGTTTAAGTSTTGGSTTGGSTEATTGQQGITNGEVPADAVAVIDGQPLLKTEFDKFLKIAQAQTEQSGSPVPETGTEEDQTLRQQVLQLLVQNTELAIEAGKKGLKPNTTAVDEALKTFRDQVVAQAATAAETATDSTGTDSTGTDSTGTGSTGSTVDTTDTAATADKAWQDYLTGIAATEADVRAQLETRDLAQQLYDLVTKDVKVTQDEIQAKYDELVKAKDPNAQPVVVTQETRKTAHILVDVGNTGDVSAADEKEAKRIIGLLDKGGDFAKLAKQYSTDEGSKENGGVYEEDAVPGFVQEFKDALFKLKTGAYTETPVKTEFGYHIIKALGDLKPETVKPLSEVTAEIEAALLDEKKGSTANDWFANLEKEYAAKTTFAAGYTLTTPDLGSTSTEGSLPAEPASGTATAPSDTADVGTATAPSDTAAESTDTAAESTDTATTDAGTTTG